MDDATDDISLLDAVTRGDHQALAVCMARYGAAVRAMCRSLAPEDADDCAQAVFLLLLRKPPHRREPGTLPSWLFTTARLVSRNARRSAHRRRRAERQMTPELPAEDPPDLDLVRRIVAELPPSERDIVMLRFWSGLDTSAVARRLGLAESTVRDRIERCLIRLRRRLGVQALALLGASAVQQLSAGEIAAWSQQCSHASPHVAALAKPSAGISASTLAVSILVVSGASAVACTMLLRQDPSTSAPAAPGAAPAIANGWIRPLTAFSSISLDSVQFRITESAWIGERLDQPVFSESSPARDASGPTLVLAINRQLNADVDWAQIDAIRKRCISMHPAWSVVAVVEERRPDEASISWLHTWNGALLDLPPVASNGLLLWTNAWRFPGAGQPMTWHSGQNPDADLPVAILIEDGNTVVRRVSAMAVSEHAGDVYARFAAAILHFFPPAPAL